MFGLILLSKNNYIRTGNIPELEILSETGNQNIIEKLNQPTN